MFFSIFFLVLFFCPKSSLTCPCFFFIIWWGQSYKNKPIIILILSLPLPLLNYSVYNEYFFHFKVFFFVFIIIKYQIIGIGYLKKFSTKLPFLIDIIKKKKITIEPVLKFDPL